MVERMRRQPAQSVQPERVEPDEAPAPAKRMGIGPKATFVDQNQAYSPERVPALTIADKVKVYYRERSQNMTTIKATRRYFIGSVQIGYVTCFRAGGFLLYLLDGVHNTTGGSFRDEKSLHEAIREQVLS